MLTKAFLEEQLEPIAAQLPILPPEFKAGFVKYVPWVTLVLLVLTIPLLIGLYALGAALFAFSSVGNIVNLVIFVLSIANLVFTVLSLKGLFGQQRQGWVFAYYATLVGVLSAILSVSIFGILFDLVWLYFLFQVRNEYYA
jgi:hypothetical protein